MAKRHKRNAEVFLNIPYDKKFEKLFLAYIAGISCFGLRPRTTLEIPGGSRRLDKILMLIAECRYSIHDLSRVELDSKSPRTPRFNMPFELGLAVALRGTGTGRRRDWFVCETMRLRLLKSLSDLNGTDPHIHDGRIAGVFRELGNIFSRTTGQPTLQQMYRVYRGLRRDLPAVLRKSGAATIYGARVFKELCVLASAYASELVN